MNIRNNDPFVGVKAKICSCFGPVLGNETRCAADTKCHVNGGSYYHACVCYSDSACISCTLYVCVHVCTHLSAYVLYRLGSAHGGWAQFTVVHL